MTTIYPSINLMTYNVWFERLHIKPRMQRILDIIAENNVDILALQEITLENLKYLIPGLKSQGFNIQHQKLSKFNHDDYGILIASKFPIIDSKQQIFPSIMGRQLLYVLVNLPDGNYGVFGVVHLESSIPGILTTDVRKQQLLLSFETLMDYSKSITSNNVNIIGLLGDTNWRDPTKNKQWDGTMILPEKWIDVAAFEPEYTYNGPENPMLNNYLKFRPDRILVCLNKPWRYICTKLLGDEPIPGYTRNIKNPLLPSDHFGLLTTLTQKPPIKLRIKRK